MDTAITHQSDAQERRKNRHFFSLRFGGQSATLYTCSSGVSAGIADELLLEDGRLLGAGGALRVGVVERDAGALCDGGGKLLRVSFGDTLGCGQVGRGAGALLRGAGLAAMVPLAVFGTWGWT